ncbi:hypothetical protein L6452_30985 [Arctium lappa]|uniref:Uncharacterized protein n=1 Tax=Arctium lappa TaxID=4217 RepID=A0ACB8ZP24_ARCLA|nr:hypothetical protein L6452_30985 [Arctium lappa]
MDHLRERLAAGNKEGILEMAKLQDPSTAISQRAREKQPTERASTPVSSEPERPEDAETVKKEIAMELNEKFALLMRTKVEAQNLINTAKEIFPDDELLERYKDELSVLFNEHGLGGSSGRRSKGMNNHHRKGKTSNAQKDNTHTPLAHNASALCTPTKLNFDGEVSLDADNPLSPYWYSQTTYDLIDAMIMHQSGGATEPVHNPGDNVNQLELPVVPYIHTSLDNHDIMEGSPEIPIQSFILGISQHIQGEDPPTTMKGKTPITSNDDQGKPVRREV